MRRFLCGVLLLFITVEAYAATERRIRTLNIGAQAVMTLVSGLVQGRVKGLAGAAKCLGSGAAGGYGAFESKILVRDGHVGKGWLLANLSASLSENAAAGKWKQAGYTVGLLRLRVSFDRSDDAYAYVDASFGETVALIQAFAEGDSVHWRSGMIAFERRTKYRAPPPRDGFDGYTWGVYPGLWKLASSEIRHHETIHAIQNLQGDAVEPSFERLTLHPPLAPQRRLIRFDHLKLGLVNGATGFALSRQKYEERWTEIEAYCLAQECP